MPRHPIDVMAKLTVKVPRGHQGYWEIVRDLGAGGAEFTLSDIDRQTNVHQQSVRDYLMRLVRAGIVDRVSEADAAAHRYRLVANPGPEAPRLRRDGTTARAPLGQENMWRTMKMAGARGFTIHDLAISASTEERPITFNTATCYVSALHRAGYLVAWPKKKGEPTTYRLLPSKISGPLAPMIQRIKAVWDPNLCRHVGPAEAERGEQ